MPRCADEFVFGGVRTIRHYGDITKIDGTKIEPVDIITFGAPCQDLSVAGLRKGMKHEDAGDDETTRSGLFYEAIRIIKEMRDHDRATGRTGELIRCRYAVYENVPGAFSSNKGADFQAVLTALVRIVEPDAPDLPLPDKGGGATAEDSMAWAPTGSPFPSLGGSTTLNIGASRKDGSASVCWLTSPDLQRLGFCLTLNTSECPRTAHPTKLSQILEVSPDSKYALSAKACQGILNRAERRGKELPPELKAALTAQSACKETESTDPIPQAATELVGGGGGHIPLTPSTGPQLSASKNEQVNQGGAKASSCRMSEREHCQPSTTNPSLTGDSGVCAGFSFGQSEKARSIGYQEEMSPTLRGGEGGNQKPCIICGNPWDSQSERVYHGDGAWHSLNANESGGQSRDGILAFAQNQRDEVRDLNDVSGSLAAEPGMKQQTFICASVDCRNGTESQEINGTIQAKPNGGFSANCNMIVRTTEER